MTDQPDQPKTRARTTSFAIDDDLMLRQARLEDADELFALVDANRQYLREWLPWLDVNTSADDSRAFIELIRDQEERGESLNRLIVHEGKIAGVVGYRSLDVASRSGELGYWIAEDAQGRGLVTRSCAELVRHGFSTLGLHRISLGAAVGNRRSRKVAERLGFREEGVLRDAEWLYDHFHDIVSYSLLENDPAVADLA